MSRPTPATMHEIFETAYNARNLDALLGLYEEGATFVPAPGQKAVGLNSIKTALEGFLGLNGTMKITTTLLIANSEFALARGRWTLNGRTPDGSPVSLEGESLEVHRRQPDGSWKMAIDLPFGVG